MCVHSCGVTCCRLLPLDSALHAVHHHASLPAFCAPDAPPSSPLLLPCLLRPATFAHLQPLLRSPLPGRRRVVLAACLHALKNPSEPNYTVASRFLAQRLLAAPGAAAAAPTGPADSSGDEVMQDASDSGLTAGLSGDTPADAQQQQQQGLGAAERPLAARVLGSLPAKDQAWVRSHVEKWSKGGCLFPGKLVLGELLLLFGACLIPRLRLQFCQPELQTCLPAPPAGIGHTCCCCCLLAPGMQRAAPPCCAACCCCLLAPGMQRAAPPCCAACCCSLSAACF